MRYAFELPGAYPAIGAEPSHLSPAPELPRPEALARALELPPPAVEVGGSEPMATTTAGPALVVLRHLRASALTGLFAQLKLFLPQATSLARQLNGSSVLLDRVDLADGEAIDLDAAALTTLRADGAYWLNGEYRIDPDKPWLTGTAQLQASDYEGDVPRAVHGRVVLRAAGERRERSMGAEPGSRWQGEGIAVAVTEWRQSSLWLDVPEGADRLLSIVALDAAGAPAGKAERIEGSHEGHSARISLRAVPQALRIRYAAESAEHTLPFSLELPQ